MKKAVVELDAKLAEHLRINGARHPRAPGWVLSNEVCAYIGPSRSRVFTLGFPDFDKERFEAMLALPDPSMTILRSAPVKSSFDGEPLCVWSWERKRVHVDPLYASVLDGLIVRRSTALSLPSWPGAKPAPTLVGISVMDGRIIAIVAPVHQ